MDERFGDKLTVRIHTLDSEEAQGYTFKSSTNVLLENGANEWVPLGTALDKNKMAEFLSERL